MTNEGRHTAPAVFLDRDGTLIEDRGHLRDPTEVVFFADTVRALQLLQQSFRLFIVTNQPGIAEGALQPAEVERVHEFILGRLARSGIHIEHVYYCPHRRSDGCSCIKPNTYFLHEASRTYGIDLRKSFVIGDHPHDVELARKAGATGIYVVTGHGARHRAELNPGVPVASGIWEAVNLVVNMGDFDMGQRPRVEIKQREGEHLELRYYGDSQNDSYRSWKMLLRQAEDLRSWWRREGSYFRDGQRSIRSRCYGCILVSMVVPTLVEVRMLDEWGKPRTVGCALPREVVEHLARYLDGRSMDASAEGATEQLSP